MIGGAGEAAVSSVRVEGGRYRGMNLLVILEGEVHDLTISHCIFTDAQYGVALRLDGSDPVADILIRNNTFLDLNHWFSISRTRGDLKSLTFERNLILDCDDFHAEGHDMADVGPRWFKDNVWRTSPGDAESVARTVAKVDLLSTDPASPDYCRPAGPATVSVKGDASGDSAYAGAVPPRRATPTTAP
jgi:hypothetical protein